MKLLYQSIRIILNNLSVFIISSGVKYSSFTNICAFILKKILANSNKKIKVGIIVSKRHCLNNKYKSGNYFNIATYYVYPNMNFNNICEIHYSTIIKVKNNIK